MIHVSQLGVVNSIKAKFPHHQLFRPPMQWNTDVRKAMTMELGRRCIQNGLEITQKSQPLCREELKKITEELLNQNTEDAIQRRIIFVSASRW